MKATQKVNKIFIILFFVLVYFLLLSSCDTMTHSTPIINTFTVSSTSVMEGDDITLNWETIEATTVFLKQISESVTITEEVDLSGSKTVFLSETTICTLIASSSYGAISESITITVNSNISKEKK